MKKILALILSLILLMISASVPLIAYSVTDEIINGTDIDTFAQDLGDMMRNEPDTIITEYHNSCKFSTNRLIIKSNGLIDTLGAVSVVNGFEGLWILQFESCEEAEEAYNYYSTLRGVEFIEADMPIESTAINQETSEEHLSWGTDHIHMSDFNNAITNLNIKTTETVVAVIDTGVEDTHPFFNGRVIPTGINTSNSGQRNSSKDDNGHGTQVSGVIIDAANESVTIRPYKVLNNYGQGTTATVAAGIICAVLDEVDVINTSLGFYEDSLVLKLAAKMAYDEDIILIGAAGNDSSDEPFYPASYPEFIKVTAVNSENTLANFSNYGADVDFAAPGVDIYTTHLNGSYFKTSGTSLAAPYVSALAASIKSLIPNGSAEDVKRVIQNNALLPAELDNAEKFGSGVINAPEIPNNVVEVNGKTETPYFSHSAAIYTEPIELEIFSDSPDSEIYYSYDDNFPSKYESNSYKYDGPIAITENTVLTAVAYSEGHFRSKFATFMCIIAEYPDESLLEIDSNGNIISYSGTSDSISIPQTVNGITVTGIGSNAFASSDIVCIKLPDTVKTISSSAFENCSKFRTIIGRGVVNVGERAFYDCTNLTYIYLGELEAIGSYSFYNVCSGINAITGATFTLDLLKVTSLPEGAFSKSAISVIELNEVYSSGKNVFTDCNQLVNISANYLPSISNNEFTGCASLKNVDLHGLTSITRYAFSGCSELEIVNLPDANFINAFAFENCTSLNSINIPLAVTVYSNAFSGCNSLRELYLPEFTTFQLNSTANGAYPSYPVNLELFYAPKLTKTVPKMFLKCPNIKNILLNSATNLVADTFNGCSDLIYLNIESVKEITQDAFSDASIRYVDARSLIKADYLPDNSGVLLSDSFVDSSADSVVNTTIYAPAGSRVEEYAANNGYNFIPVPFIENTLPEFVNQLSETVSFIPVGFNLKMQWYYSDSPYADNAVPIEGATSFNYTFNHDDPDGYYFCRVTQNYGSEILTTDTSFVIRDTVPADYTLYNIAAEKARSLNKQIYKDFSEVEKALSVDVSGLYSHNQSVVDDQTQMINLAIKNLEFKKVSNFRIFAKKTNLKVMQSAKIYVGIGPENSTYKSIIYSVDNPDVILISKSGYVRCVGSGKATVTATLTNYDGSVLTAKLNFNCKTSPETLILSVLFKLIMFLFSSRYYQ